MDDTKNFESFLEDLLNKEVGVGTEKLREDITITEEVLENKPTAEQRNPFKFLDAYTPEDRDIFFGRDMEIKELYHSVFSHKVTVVFGSSGAGKTSLLQCGLINRLKPEKTYLFTLRSALDPLTALRDECLNIIDREPAAPDLYGLVKHTSQSLRKTMILLFDQFEEIFILQPFETRKILAMLFKQILHSELDIKIVLSIREEYFARLLEFEKVVPDILAHRVWVRTMSRMQIESVIINPCRVCEVSLDPEVPVQVINELGQSHEGLE